MIYSRGRFPSSIFSWMLIYSSQMACYYTSFYLPLGVKLISYSGTHDDEWKIVRRPCFRTLHSPKFPNQHLADQSMHSDAYNYKVFANDKHVFSLHSYTHSFLQTLLEPMIMSGCCWRCKSSKTWWLPVYKKTTTNVPQSRGTTR